jgi:hypothetical protein
MLTLFALGITGKDIWEKAFNISIEEMRVAYLNAITEDKDAYKLLSDAWTNGWEQYDKNAETVFSVDPETLKATPTKLGLYYEKVLENIETVMGQARNQMVHHAIETIRSIDIKGP